MADLVDHESFSALIRLLDCSDTIADWRARSPSIERLRLALLDTVGQPSALDLAVLLRQAMTHEHVRRGGVIPPSVRIMHPRFSGFDAWDLVGLQASPSDQVQNVTLLPWQPTWLANVGDGVEIFAASEVVRREFDMSGEKGDPLLASVGRTSYRSKGQRAAVRAALSTPAGGSLVIALPTGEGKSLIFQLIHKVGFVGGKGSDNVGVTLVIVPTVALGVNHEQEAITVCGLEPPLSFQGGDDARNSIIAERIADGTQGLCFASPEAACGRLRSSLRKAAEAGLLRALVIDEAHLVDQWGTGFRTEFQELSGLRRELLAAAPERQAIRTIMLSATLTDTSSETLRSLFGGESNFESLAAVQLRPEPDYWIAPLTDEATRTAQVLDALHHVPRPAVLYVTEVEAANAWYARLLKAGFKRVRKLHGMTGSSEREEIVGKWREGNLDLVVGTSAFGLGIDYAHARTVIHACVPETLDRFYQEVGRGGRDGWASLSLILPTAKDLKIAKRISVQKVISIKRGLHRWTEMFEAKKRPGPGRFAVRIDGRPGTNDQDIDMFGDANTDWNLRTLALMTRAGILRLLGTPYPAIEEEGDWLEIEITDGNHLDSGVWRDRVEPVRQVGRRAAKRNFELMREYLRDERCPATILEELYGSDRIGRSCSRCSRCRIDETSRHKKVAVGEPLVLRTESLDPLIANLFDLNLKLLVTYDPEDLGRSASRRLGDTLQRLQQARLAKLIMLGQQPFDMDRVLQFAEKSAFFVSQLGSLGMSRLPLGPELVMVGEGQNLNEQNLKVRPDNPRIFLVPHDQNAPNGHRLRTVFGGRTLTLDEFNARVAQ